MNIIIIITTTKYVYKIKACKSDQEYIVKIVFFNILGTLHY